MGNELMESKCVERRLTQVILRGRKKKNIMKVSRGQRSTRVMSVSCVHKCRGRSKSHKLTSMMSFVFCHFQVDVQQTIWDVQIIDFLG